jgi:hypothetical protein
VSGQRRRIMAVDKDKGLVEGLQYTLRQTAGALRGEGPWYSVNSEVYHNNPNCQTGNSMNPENVRQGTGGKPLCGGVSGSTRRAAPWAM